MFELNEQEMEMAAGGHDYNYNFGSFNGDNNQAGSVAASDQEAASLNTLVGAGYSNVGNVAQSADNTSLAALISKSFNHSFNTKK